MTSLPKVKALAGLFFPIAKRLGDGWVCDVCGASVLQRMSEYTTMYHRVMNKHSDLIAERHGASQKRKREPFHVMTYPARIVAAHGWLECVVHYLTPFQFVENNVIRRNFRHNSNSVDTLVRYLHKLMSKMEEKIKNALPEKFAIILDGCAGGDTHFVSVFATYQPAGYNSALLALAPMGALNANEYNEF